MFQYKKRTVIPLPLEQVFQYHLNIRNICKQAPPYIKIGILKGSDNLKKGDTVKLQIKILGVQFIWESAIEDFVQDAYFTDKMKKGPFKSWEHTHLFQKCEGGTIMTDIISYELHFGLAGLLANKIFVHKMLDDIFIIRHNFDKDMKA